MLRKLLTGVLVALVLSFCKTSCYAYGQEVARYRSVQLLFVNYDYNGEWKSRAYSHPMKNGRHCLIVYTHGCLDYENNYRICIGSEQSRDYVSALENELIYWHNSGKLNVYQYDHIHLGTCYCGYMEQEFTLPRLNKKVHVISDYTGITYYQEWAYGSRVTEVAFGNVY